MNAVWTIIKLSTDPDSGAGYPCLAFPAAWPSKGDAMAFALDYLRPRVVAYMKDKARFDASRNTPGRPEYPTARHGMGGSTGVGATAMSEYNAARAEWASACDTAGQTAFDACIPSADDVSSAFGLNKEERGWELGLIEVHIGANPAAIDADDPDFMASLVDVVL